MTTPIAVVTVDAVSGASVPNVGVHVTATIEAPLFGRFDSPFDGTTDQNGSWVFSPAVFGDLVDARIDSVNTAAAGYQSWRIDQHPDVASFVIALVRAPTSSGGSGGGGYLGGSGGMVGRGGSGGPPAYPPPGTPTPSGVDAGILALGAGLAVGALVLSLRG